MHGRFLERDHFLKPLAFSNKSPLETWQICTCEDCNLKTTTLQDRSYVWKVIVTKHELMASALVLKTNCIEFDFTNYGDTTNNTRHARWTSWHEIILCCMKMSRETAENDIEGCLDRTRTPSSVDTRRLYGWINTTPVLTLHPPDISTFSTWRSLAFIWGLFLILFAYLDFSWKPESHGTLTMTKRFFFFLFFFFWQVWCFNKFCEFHFQENSLFQRF